MEVNEDNFDREVLKSDRPVIVDYWAPWCQPCRMMTPVLEKLSEQMENVKFFKINVDDNTNLAQQQGVMGIPCLIIYKDGEEVDRIVGFQPEPVLRQKLNAVIS